MATPARQDTNEQRLRDAIHTATGLTLADRWVFDTLLWMADYGTAFLPDRFQPRSLAQLAGKSFVSARQVKYSLSHLQRHGWLERHRVISETGIGGRGNRTRYVLCAGRSCDCKGGTQCTVPAGKQGSQCTGNRAESPHVAAGQAPDAAGRAVAGEVREGKPWRDEQGDYTGGPVTWPGDSVGAEVNSQ